MACFLFHIPSTDAYKPCWRQCDGIYTQCGQAAPNTFMAIIKCQHSLSDCRENCRREILQDNISEEIMSRRQNVPPS